MLAKKFQPKFSSNEIRSGNLWGWSLMILDVKRMHRCYGGALQILLCIHSQAVSAQVGVYPGGGGIACQGVSAQRGVCLGECLPARQWGVCQTPPPRGQNS